VFPDIQDKIISMNNESVGMMSISNYRSNYINIMIETKISPYE